MPSIKIKMHYISNTGEQRMEMLNAIGADSIMDLFKDVPAGLVLKREFKLPPAVSEIEVKRLLENLASKNSSGMLSFLGGGAYSHYIPAIVQHLILRGEFFTSYTPYQAEASQGMLQSIFEYQTMVCSLTGMDVANASMYDNSSALAEAAIMSCRIKGKKRVLVAKAIHPEHREVVKTYLKANSIELAEIGHENLLTKINGINKSNSFGDFSAVLVQNPNFFGSIENLKEIEKFAHENDALLVASVNEPTSLGILNSPGSYGADIVVGEGQSFGNSLSFGGPYVGFMATKKEYLRQMPGRIVGQTLDSNEKRGFVLTLQAREQHIRREKATSNICTNQALNALAMTITLATYGKELRNLAIQNMQKAHYAAKILREKGIKIISATPFYNEFVVNINNIHKLKQHCYKNNIIPGLELEKFYPELKNTLLVCVTEMHTKDDIDNLVQVLC